MGNPFSCCHPGRKEVDQGSRKDRDRLLQDSATQTPAGDSGSGFGSIRSPGDKDGEHSSRGIAADSQPSGSKESRADSSVSSSSSSGGGGGGRGGGSGSSNGALRAAPMAIGSEQQQQQQSAVGSGAGGQCSAAERGGTRGSSAAAAAAATATSAASGGHGDPARGSGGIAARAHPAGLSAGANGSAAPAPAYRSAGAMPRAHPNDQQRRNQQLAAGGTHGGDARMGGRSGVQQYGGGAGAGAVARGGGRFGTTALVASARGAGVAGKTVARSVPAAAGTVLAKYELREVLGVGSTSKCYRCVNRRNKKQFACKVRGASA